MSLRISCACLSSFAVFLAVNGSAQADMGRAPTVQGTYVSFEGGFLLLDGDGANGHGITAIAGATIDDVQVAARDGWFAGGLIGFAGQQPLIAGLPFKRIELYGLYGQAEDGASHTAPPLGDISLKNDSAAILINGGKSGVTSTERTIAEGQVRLEGDDIINATTSITWVVAPFMRWNNEDVTTVVTGCCNLIRDANVETRMYGIIVAAEPEVWLTPQMAIVGRLGVGIYGFDADGSYRSRSTLPGPDPFGATISDGDSGVGFRGQLGAGLKFKLTSNANLETFAEADYFSDVASADTADNQPGGTTASHTGSDSQWEFRAGARITIGLGP
jgi:hypothetical protein